MANLLLVEDENIISMQLEKRLRTLGHDVVGCATNANESIDMAKRYNPDLILMDIVMPGELDGIDAAEIITRECDIPIIYLTAWADDEFIDRAKLTNPYGYIIKPYHINEVKAVIDVALHKKQTDRHLYESENHFRAILEQLDEAFISLNGDLTVRYLNASAARMLGRDARSLVDRSVFDHIDLGSRDTFNDLAVRIMAHAVHPEHEKLSGRIVIVNADDIRIPVSIVMVCCCDATGPFICLIAHKFAPSGESTCAICSHCKRIRDDNNEWVQLESYLSARLDISFTHSICPACIKKHYPDLSE